MFYFIVDPSGHDGRGYRVWRRIQRKLGRLLSGESYEVFLMEKAGDARDFSRRVTERDEDKKKTLIVVGEATTLNEVVDGSRLDADNVSLAFFSSGKEELLRLPRRMRGLKRRLKRILAGEEALYVDYGVLGTADGHRRFVQHAGVGFEGAFLQQQLLLGRYASGKRRFFRFPRLRYGLLFLRILLHLQQGRGYVLLDDEKRLEFNNLCFVSVFLHPFGMPAPSDPEAGGMELCIVRNRRRLRLLRILFSTMRGVHRELAGVYYYRCNRAFVHLEEPMSSYADGSFCGAQQDIHLHCVPGKLRLLV